MMSGLFQINPIWNLGPYNPSQVSAGVQPDFYMGFLDGMVRIWPAWEIRNLFGHYMIPAVFFPAILGATVLMIIVIAYPWIEKAFTKDKAIHNILQRPRDVPVRTALGVAFMTFYLVNLINGANDLFAFKLDISLNVMTWLGRILSIVGPVIAYVVTYRLCLGLQHSDRAVLEHGIETGVLKRLPSGEFIEVHQPLGPVDDHGHPIPLAYQGAPVPKRMNQLGSAGVAVPGLLTPANDEGHIDLSGRRSTRCGDRGRHQTLIASFARRSKRPRSDIRAGPFRCATKRTCGAQPVVVADRTGTRGAPAPPDTHRSQSGTSASRAYGRLSTEA